MPQRYRRKLLNKYSASALAIIVIGVAVGVVVIIKPGSTDATTPKKVLTGAAVPSQFKFSGSPGWWQGATNKTSIAIFPDAHDCFVSVQHITGTSVAAHQAKMHASDGTLASSGHTITQIGTQEMTIQTNTGTKQYQLQQTNVTNPAGASADSGTQLEGGVEEGYLQLSDNAFIYIEGDCDTAAELPTTFPVLQAITFNDKGKG